jgi:hypothetical protein
MKEAVADERQHSRIRDARDKDEELVTFNLFFGNTSKLTPRPCRELSVALFPELLHTFLAYLLQALSIIRLFSSVQFSSRQVQIRP